MYGDIVFQDKMSGQLVIADTVMKLGEHQEGRLDFKNRGKIKTTEHTNKREMNTQV